MRVLVVAKTTNLELHGQTLSKRIAAGALDESDLAQLQQAHDEHYQTLQSLQDALSKRSIQYEIVTAKRRVTPPPRVLDRQ